MNPTANPFAPGAGTRPPELAGRDEVLASAELAIHRKLAGKASRSFIFVGLRGVGKTVLLNEVQTMAERHGAYTDFIEISSIEPLSKSMIATLRAALLRLDRLRGVNDKVKRALRVLKSFVTGAKVKYGEIEFSIDIDAETGVADSGTLSRDLAELFVAAGEAAQARDASIVLLIDEIQNLPRDEFEALIMAVHRVDQKGLPVLIVGAGLPQLLKLSGDAKSYAERLFEYPDIGPLDRAGIKRAIAGPLAAAGVAIDADAVALIAEQTQGYPYFLQEWGYQAWNQVNGDRLSRVDIERAGAVVEERLDRNFFRSRYERLSEPQKAYLRAMAELGPGPHRSGDVARQLGKTVQQLGTTRDGLISNGMIYSPKYGFAAFTVPLFDAFMRRAEGGGGSS
jgi:hypothetical protein